MAEDNKEDRNTTEPDRTSGTTTTEPDKQIPEPDTTPEVVERGLDATQENYDKLLRYYHKYKGVLDQKDLTETLQILDRYRARISSLKYPYDGSLPEFEANIAEHR